MDRLTAALRMTSSISSLVEYLKNLHVARRGIWNSLQKEAPLDLAVEIKPAMERLQLVYQFDQECVDNVKIVTGTGGEGPSKKLSPQLSLKMRDD